MAERVEGSRSTAGTSLPSGTVTFLFSDIEGSTRLFQRLGDAYPVVLAEHRRLLELAFDEEGGRVVDAEGDGLFVAFEDANAAVRAAVAAQVALHAHPWADSAQVRVRMGIHSGRATPVGGNYVALAVHQAARIAAAAHGGQVLLSDVTRSLVDAAALPSVTMADLGLHRLKDFDLPQRLYQLVHPELPGTFPAIRTLSGAAHNLPLSRSTFVGREREAAVVDASLARPGLVTLVGPGGVGKTRLALDVAISAASRYRDGVWLADLAAVTDGPHVEAAVAAAVGVREQPERPLVETLSDALAAKHALVLFDNCEHVVDACAALTDRLLRSSPQLTILATSREPLDVAGEQVLTVPPLNLPASGRDMSVAELADVDAVALFVDRARSAADHFALTPQNAEAVAQLCVRLDGLPLAIELAAARSRSFSPHQLLARLDLLTSGGRTALARHQTLRAAIEWSYDLLNRTEKTLFRRVSVFAGDFTAEAAEDVCSGKGVASATVASLIGALVDKSLVHVNDEFGGMRYRLLNSVRMYAQERLREDREATVIARRFVAWALAFVEPATVRYESDSNVDAWLGHVRPEVENLRHAASIAGGADAQTALAVTGALGPLWSRIGPIAEGRTRLQAALAAVPATPSAARARALRWSGFLATSQGDYVAARALLSEAITVAEQVGDRRQHAACLRLLAHAPSQYGEFDVAREHLSKAMAIYRELGDEAGEIDVLVNLGGVATDQGDYDFARSCLLRALAFRRRHGDMSAIARCANNLGYAALLQGDLIAARPPLEEALASYRCNNAKYGVALAAGNLALLNLHERRLDEAQALFAEELEVARQLGMQHAAAEALHGLGEVALKRADTTKAKGFLVEALHVAKESRVIGVPSILAALAHAALADGQYERAAELLGASRGLSQRESLPLSALHSLQVDEDAVATQAMLGEKDFLRAWEAGRTASLEDAVSLGLLTP